MWQHADMRPVFPVSASRPFFQQGCRAHIKNLVFGDETKYTVANRLTTALELSNTHSTSDAVVLAATQNHWVNLWRKAWKVEFIHRDYFCCTFSSLVMRLGFIWMPYVTTSCFFSWLGKSVIIQDMNKPLIDSKWMLKCHVCVLLTKVQCSSFG